MKKKYNILKIISLTFIMIVCFNIFSSNTFAMTSSYGAGKNQTEVNAKVSSMFGVISKIILPIVYPLFSSLARLMQKIMYVFTGTYTFPWADSIIFNRLPFLDINFLNPEPGSLFMSSSGTYTLIGKTVRSTYFSVLSICVGFLGIAVAINVIKMLLATIPSAKARYKEMINATVGTVILIFCLHYVMAFVFYLNEQLVQVASNMSEKILNGDTISAASENLTNAEDADNEKLVVNFFKKCNHTSLLSPVTIVKKLVKEVANLGDKIINWCSKFGETLKNAWDNFWGKDNQDEEITISSDDKESSSYYKEVFPSKEDFIGYFYDEQYVGKNGINIAAYLLKDYIYRDSMLSMVAGNDTNKFANAGIWGWAKSAGNTILWFTGVVDTGLQGLENLYNSVCYIYNDLPKESGVDLSSAAACKKTIEKFIAEENKETDDVKISVAHVKTLYCKAYYRYVYEGSDKDTIKEQTSVIQSLGEYFKRNVYYTDVDSGQWSPDTFDAIMCTLYCIFVLQSFMFLFSYIKRLFYIIVLAMIGPATVVYDYVKKSY